MTGWALKKRVCERGREKSAGRRERMADIRRARHPFSPERELDAAGERGQRQPHEIRRRSRRRDLLGVGRRWASISCGGRCDSPSACGVSRRGPAPGQSRVPSAQQPPDSRAASAAPLFFLHFTPPCNAPCLCTRFHRLLCYRVPCFPAVSEHRSVAFHLARPLTIVNGSSLANLAHVW